MRQSVPFAPMRLLMPGCVLFALVLYAFAAIAAAAAPASAPKHGGEQGSQTGVWKQQLDVIDTEFRTTRPPTDAFLAKVAADLDRIASETAAFIAENTPVAADAKALLDKFGEAPKEGALPESEDVARQRVELTKRFTEIDGAIRSAAALRERTGQLREAVLVSRRDLFLTEILHKGRSPFSLALWREGVPDLIEAGRRIATHVQRWASANSPRDLGLIALAVGTLALLLRLVSSRLIARYRAGPTDVKVPLFRQTTRAVIVALLRALPLLLAAVALYFVLQLTDMLTPPFDEIVPVALFALVAVNVIHSLSTTLLDPKHPHWRILPVSTANARRLERLLLAIATVFGIDLFLDFVNRALRMPLSLTVLQSAVAAVLFAGLLIGVLRTPFRAHAIGGVHATGRFVRLLKLPLWLVVFAVLAATAFGYIALARFLTQQTVVTGYIFILAYLGYLAISEFTDSFADGDSYAGRFLRTTFDVQKQRREQLGAITMLLLNGLLIAATLPFLALQWGFSWDDVATTIGRLLFGIEFGGLHISLIALLIAVALFLGGLLLTRFFQRWLDQRILSKSQSQTGAEHSIKTAVGYAGFVASALLAVSYAGFGFANIALVAGALSVGIGFGLQSIVNNFVSGLILLAERPIKVGDWIVVGQDEGYVRRISVRSTEIETFDRAHIIVPNSELISGTVKNWTLRGPLGRISIAVGVAYAADTKKVQELLLDIARHNPSVLEYPAPFVVFERFGESSLDFTLRAFVSDITAALAVRTALRHEIIRRFRDEGIEIPYRQTDLHIRDAAGLASLLRGPPPMAPATPVHVPDDASPSDDR